MSLFLPKFKRLRPKKPKITRPKIAKVSFPTACFALTFFLLPLFFTPFTFEYYQTGKLILLSISLILLALFYIGRLGRTKKFQFLISPFYLPITVLLLSFLVSTILSTNVIDSFLGPHRGYHGGFLSYLVYFTLFCFSLNLLEEEEKVLRFAVLGGLLLAILFTLQYFEIYLFPFAITHQRFWTTMASSFTTVAYLSLLAPIVLWLISRAVGPKRIFYILVFLLFIFDIALLNLSFIWITVVVSIFALILSSKGQIFKKYRSLVVPLLLGVLLSSLSFWGIRRLVLPQNYLTLPQELTLPLSTSWQITTAILAARPLLGIGPGNFGLYYPQLRPLSTISLPTYQVRFTQAGSEAFELLSSLGIIGGLGLILLFVSLVRSVLAGSKEKPISFFLAASAISGGVLLLTTGGTVSLLALFFLVLGLWSKQLAGEKKIEIAFPKLSLWDGRRKREKEFPTSLVVIGTLLVLLLLVVVGGRFILADVFYVNASSALGMGDGQSALTFIMRAQNLNPYRDEFAVGDATINLALASTLSQVASPSAQIQNQTAFFTQQAINSARRATALNPQKVANWENLASVYSNFLTYLPGADQAMVAAYQQATVLDPLNPILHKVLGDAAATTKMFNQAISSYQQAITLRTDLAGAYLGLARVYKAAGQNEQAVRVYEQLLSFDFDETSEIYQVIKTEYGQAKEAAEEKTLPSTSPVEKDKL